MPDAMELPVRASTQAAPLDDDLLSRADAQSPLLWRRGADVLVGIGETLRLRASGEHRITDLANAWNALTATAVVDDAIQQPGTGLVGFGSVSFAAESAQESVLIVPRILLGRRNGVDFVTRIWREGEDIPKLPAVHAIDSGARANWFATTDRERHLERVREILRDIEAGAVKKVVLARAVAGTLPADSDVRGALNRLAQTYPDTWTFAVDGLLGASPETLLAVSEHRARVRILAGTSDRAAAGPGDLLDSAKDTAEHQFAVESVTEALARAGVSNVSVAGPTVLDLPGLRHLASDVSFETREADLLRLISALHPTAAVAGTPTAAALASITAVEGLDRGRYAGPVGWLDTRGNGEWAIALRCAEVRGTRVRAFAGGGIVAGSEPEAEFAETELKLAAIRSAL